jgi:type II secretory pathway pseudopilin PulG
VHYLTHGRKRYSLGFTFVELAIALVIIGLLIAGMIGPLETRMEATERQKTQESLEEIKEALYGFAVTHGRLPCPDCSTNAAGCNDGAEDRKTITPPSGIGTALFCVTDVGNLPWQELGISGQDVWGRNFLYRMEQEFGDDPELQSLGTECSEQRAPGPGSHARWWAGA